MRQFLLYISILLALFSCKGGSKTDVPTDAASVEMHYAQLLSMKQKDGIIYAEIKNPWDTTKLLHKYALVDSTSSSDGLKGWEIVRIPLTHSIVYTSVHSGLVDQLGAYSAIKGICDLDYIFLQKIHADVKAGKIVDVGNSMTPDIEKIMDLNPDAILLSPFENSGTYGKVGKLGIPLIECADYMENSALGRAEWMRFYGILFGKRKQADSIFASVEADYNATKELCKTVKHKPTVVTETKFGNTWYVAGGNSYVGRLLADAGADYVFKTEKSSGAVPYDPEVVFDKAQSSEYWIFKYSQITDKTYSELSKDWTNNSRMSAFINKKVYGCNLSKTNFYEETPFYPNLLLKDLVYVFHPDLLKGYAPRYYKNLGK